MLSVRCFLVQVICRSYRIVQVLHLDCELIASFFSDYFHGISVSMIRTSLSLNVATVNVSHICLQKAF